MPEYLSPGVYIQEPVGGARPIRGVANERRLLSYLEKSIQEGTQWVVFETNGPQLWARMKATVVDFLLDPWRAGLLKGAKAEEAFFVRCDQSTMNQDDIDSGRLVCLVGAALMRPAEFVVFRIVQWTADAKGS